MSKVPAAQNGDLSKNGKLPETKFDPGRLINYTGREKSGVVFDEQKNTKVPTGKN